MKDLEKSKLFQDLSEEWRKHFSSDGKLEALTWVVGLYTLVQRQYQGDWSFVLDRLRKLGRFEQAAAIEAIAPVSLERYLLFRMLAEKYDRNLMEAQLPDGLFLRIFCTVLMKFYDFLGKDFEDDDNYYQQLAKEYVQLNNLMGILQSAFLPSDIQLQRLAKNFNALEIESGS